MRLLLLRLLDRFDADGTNDALLGDIAEELSRGRSRLWAWQQILALGGLTAMQGLHRAALRPTVIVMAPGISLVSALSFAPAPQVLVSWAVVYFMSGVLSLFFDLVSTAADDWEVIGSHRQRDQRQ